MFVRLERLLSRLRQPASRADELIALRHRVRDELASKQVDDEERALARDVHAKKLAVSAALQGVSSCASCAKGQPSPVGDYAGGACCSGVTADLFDSPELAALVHAGTRVADLAPPSRTDHHAGCAFRGAHGCSLDVEARPSRCVHYVCDGLRHELHDRGQLDDIEAKLAELNAAMRAFTVVHNARRDREVLAPLIAALENATRR
ncbi:MAG TPA: hypothetical protein VMZ53_09795 [Kofleriaceae bacterium]|nr:hypothetical protein [Kofleriaceae bacterium]